MKNLSKHATTVATVAVGVMLAGYIMHEFKSKSAILNTASEGFQGL